MYRILLMNSLVRMRYLYLLVYIFMFFSCNHSKEDLYKVQIIDFDSEEKIKLSELFQECKIVPLETTDSSLIGVVVSRVEYYENRIYILNQLTSHKNILCFDSSGHFLFNIDRIGRAPDEYTYLGDFFIDKNKRQIVLVSENKRFLFFDLDGHYLYNKNSSDFYIARQFIFNDSNYIAYCDVESSSVHSDLLIIDSATMNIKQKLKYNGDLTYNSGGRVLSVYNGHILYYHFNDTVYNISTDRLRNPSYYLNCGKTQIESKELIRKKRRSMNDDQLVMFIYSLIKEGKLRHISSILENETLFVVNGMEIKEENMSRAFFVLYDKNTKNTYCSSNIDFEFLNSVNTNLQIVSCLDGSLYCLVNNEFSLDELKQIKQCTFLTSEDKEILLQREEGDNPFLIRLK